MVKKGKGLMAYNKEDLVKMVNDLQNKIANPPPKQLPSKFDLVVNDECDDAAQVTEEKTNSSSNSSSTLCSSTSGTSPNDSILETILSKVHSLEQTVQKLLKENTSLKYELKILKNQTEDTDDRIYEIEKEVTRMDQYTRRWNIEIQNIPEDVPQDQLKPSVVNALNQMNVNVQEEGIEAIHRLKKGKKSKGPPSVIVRFRKRDDAFRTLQNKRETKKVEKNTFGQSMKTNIFIHENLGPRAKEIFDFCLKMQKDGVIYKVWTVKGITHFVFENNKREKPTKVYHYDDLWELFPDAD